MPQEKRIPSPSKLETEAKNLSFPISREVADIFTLSDNHPGAATVPELISGLVHGRGVAAEIFHVLGIEHPKFINPGQYLSSSPEEPQAILQMNDAKVQVNQSVANYLHSAALIAGEGNRMDTGHLLQAIINDTARDELYSLLNKDSKPNVDWQRYLTFVADGCRKRLVQPELASGSEIRLSYPQALSDLMEAAKNGELDDFSIPAAWLNKLIDALRNNPTVRIESNSELEAELIAKTLASQLAQAKHSPITAEQIIFINQEMIIAQGMSMIDRALRQTKDGILFLPLLPGIYENETLRREAISRGTKLVFCGPTPKDDKHQNGGRIFLENPTIEELTAMFKPFIEQLEVQLSVGASSRVRISKKSLEILMPLAMRYAGNLDRSVIDTAVTLCQTAGTNLSLAHAKLPLLKKMSKSIRRDNTIDPEDLYQAVFDLTGIEVKPDKPERFLELAPWLKERIIGQDEVIDHLAAVIQRAKAGLKDPERPIGGFIFLGPSGVGKTELAKSLAEFLFGDAGELIQLDMTEYVDKMDASRLTGAPPGYVGYEEGGQLTNAVKKKPYSVVVFDELDKAHPDVRNVLFQILDRGQLTDSRGVRVDFRNTVVIATGNVGSDEYARLAEIGEAGVRQRVIKMAFDVFSAPLLNRFSGGIQVFRSLNLADLTKIVGLEVKKTSKKLMSMDIRVSLKVSEAAAGFLAKLAYDPRLNGRNVRTTVEREIENRLGQPILEGQIKPGDLVQFELNGDELEWTSTHPQA